MHPQPPTAHAWLPYETRAGLRDAVRRVLRRSPGAKLAAAVGGRRFWLRLPHADETARHPTPAVRTSVEPPPDAVDLPLLDLVLELRPYPAPTPPSTAALASGDALYALARAGDMKDLGVRTFGRGRAAWALIERVAALPMAFLRRPDVVRLWSPATGVWCERGFEPPVPAGCVSRWLGAGEVVFFRSRGGSLHSSGTEALAPSTRLLAVRVLPREPASAARRLVALRLAPGAERPWKSRGVLVEPSALCAFARWLTRAPAPMLGGLSVYRDHRFWLVLREPDASCPPLGSPLTEVETGGRRMLLPSDLRFVPEVPASAIFDALGVGRAERVLVRRGEGSRPEAVLVPDALFAPLDRRLAAAVAADSGPGVTRRLA